MKKIVDETIEQKQISGDTEYLNQLITDIINEDKK